MILSQILVYPIKSLDGVSMKKNQITSGGILKYDRIYAIMDTVGTVVNGKRTPRIQLLRSAYDENFQEVALWVQGDSFKNHFSLNEPKALNQWLSDFFGFGVRLMREDQRGFPDDLTARGPTIVSEASLKTIAGWFPGLTTESARRRFRSNLEIGGVTPFWEDHLFAATGELKSFSIGEVQFFGHNPCQRCVVPTRDPDNTLAMENFQKTFMELRRKQLPSWSNPERFNHYYRFAINTSVPDTEAGKVLEVGASIKLSPHD